MARGIEDDTAGLGEPTHGEQEAHGCHAAEIKQSRQRWCAAKLRGENRQCPHDTRPCLPCRCHRYDDEIDGRWRWLRLGFGCGFRQQCPFQHSALEWTHELEVGIAIDVHVACDARREDGVVAGAVNLRCLRSF